MFSLIELIYGAVDDASLWNLVMDGVAEAVNGQWTVVWSSFGHPAAGDITAWARLDPTVLSAYAQHYASVNVISQEIDRQCPNDLIAYSQQVIPDVELEKSEYYNDYLKPSGMFYAYGMKVGLGLAAPAFISSVRSKSRGPFGTLEGVVFETLLPHLQRAMKLHIQFSQLRSNADSLEHSLNAFDVAVFGLSQTGDVVLMNHAAQQIVQTGDGLGLKRGRLTAQVMKQDAQLQSLIAGAITTEVGSGLPRSGALLISRRLKTSALRLTITSVPSAFTGHTAQLAALVFIADPERKPLSRSESLRALFSLSPTECRLADLLAAGNDVVRIADLLSMSIATTRFHLKSVFRKTGVNRQSDLVRLVLSIPGIATLCSHP